MKFIPHNYQKVAQKHLLKFPEAGLFMDMGLGKSVVSLTAIQKLMYEDYEIGKVLVIAPKQVSENVWTDEIEKWDHIYLKPVIISGTEKKRIEKLKSSSDIYIISVGLLTWLIAYLQGHWPYDMIVIDELSMFKSSNSKRFRALKVVRPASKRVVGLTGTPTGNGLVDLWPEMYLLDQGKRLGKTVTFYREHYLSKKKTDGVIVVAQLLKRPFMEK